MRYREIIGEYQIIADPDFEMPDFTKGEAVGKIRTKLRGELQVWKMQDGDQIGYAAIRPKIGPKKPLGYLGFKVGKNLLMARAAYVDPKYQKKAIASELMLFVNDIEGHKILGDTLLTVGGEALWTSLIQSRRFDVKIFYQGRDGVELFDLSDVGQEQTHDGLTVISPKLDDKSRVIYSPKNPTGQRFFYFLESCGVITECALGFDPYGHHRSIKVDHLIQCYCYFSDDAP